MDIISELLNLRWTLQLQHQSQRGWCAQSQRERRFRACLCPGLSSFLLPKRSKVSVFVLHGRKWFKHAPLLPPFSEAKMEIILFLDFLSSGTDGSGRELWIADCESLGPPPWLLILTGGAGGLSSHTMLSHIYTGVHLHAREETRPIDGWVILARKLHLGRGKDGGLMCGVLLHTAAEWGSLGLRITCTNSSVSVSSVSGGIIILLTSFLAHHHKTGRNTVEQQ